MSRSVTKAVAVHRLLHEGWTVEAVGGRRVPAGVAGVSVAATVPGSVHTDLLAAGLIVDPYLDDNERLLAWIGSTSWRYSTSFDWVDAGHDRTDLAFLGLDTVATVRLNGAVVLESRNMHRTYRVPVRDALVAGRNELIVDFDAPVPFADRMSLEQGYRPQVNQHPFNAIRKMACSFGWDWGPDTATVGIWRPVELHSWSVARLSAVRPIATVDGAGGTLVVHVGVERAGDAPLTLRVMIDGQSVEVGVQADAAAATIELANVHRWWPRGYGPADLYDVEVHLLQSGQEIDGWSGRVGFRSVRLDTIPDEHGTSMTFVVNEVPVFIRGANWIPDDAFPHRVTRSRYEARIRQAVSANISLLRVWGGGIYESDDFYELCDELGVLTWQDFLFACAAYPEEEPMRSEVEAEARDNVARLMPHPSLVLWNGNNENIWGHDEWNWEKHLRGSTWGLGYYLELLPAVVAELDGTRPYTPGSPFSPGSAHAPNDPAHGSVHIWDLWNRRDYPEYRSYLPRFVGEFGWQGPPTWSTLTRSISDEPLTPESPGMLVHQKAAGGNVKLIDGLIEHLPLPNEIEDWHWAMSLNQATAMGVAIEHFRSLSPLCGGSLLWQLNDCWPVTSWSAVDGDGHPKPLLYSIRHSYADRLVTLQPRAGALAAILVNDHSEGLSGELRLARLDFAGTELASATVAVELGARSSATIEIPPRIAVPGNAAREVLVAAIGDIRSLWFFAEYRDSELGAARLSARAERTVSGYRVFVEAGSLIRDLAVLADKVHPDAVVDDMLVTLLPGESAVFDVASDAEFNPEELIDPRVLRNANQLIERWGDGR
ncbi:MAG: glycoside hydrolase family 2 protein [Lacisediminihabitans sp.]